MYIFNEGSVIAIYTNPPTFDAKNQVTMKKYRRPNELDKEQFWGGQMLVTWF